MSFMSTYPLQQISSWSLNLPGLHGLFQKRSCELYVLHLAAGFPHQVQSITEMHHQLLGQQHSLISLTPSLIATSGMIQLKANSTYPIFPCPFRQGKQTILILLSHSPTYQEVG